MAEKHVRMAAHLYEAREAARTILGAKFDRRMAEYGDSIREVAKRHGITEMQAAVRLAQAAQKDGQAYTAALVLAAMVELAEPSPRTEGC